MKLASGSDTSGLKHIENSALISPRWIASMISGADRPGPGRLSGSTPHTPAMYLRCSGSVIDAHAGQLIALLPVLAAALAVALAGDHHAAGALAAEVAGREEEVEHREAVLDALRVVLDAARVDAHGAIGLADPVRRLFDLRRRERR